MKTTKIVYLVLAAVAIPSLQALPQGPPCWDTVPPNVKYANRHVVTGETGLSTPSDKEETHTLSVDGLVVASKLLDGDSYLEVQVSLTNCGSKTVEIVPQKSNLFMLNAQGTTKLKPIDPTRFVRWPKTGKTFPALVAQTLKYGSIASISMFFVRDGRAQSSDNLHSNYHLQLAIPIENWEFDFTFPRKAL